jgi:aspartyl-tRNA(Asn)/glutamyl-tRNA(Gln) amidotransferase subunit C
MMSDSGSSPLAPHLILLTRYPTTTNPDHRNIHSAVSQNPPTSISLDDVRKVASLSRLALTDAQLDAAQHDLAAVLTYMTRLQSLDLRNVQPLTSIAGENARLDPDTPGPTLSNDQLLAMAPDTMPPFIKVPKVLGEGAA